MILRLTTIAVVINTHLTSCLWSINVDLLLCLAIKSFYGHDGVVRLSLAVTLCLLVLVFKRSTPHFYEINRLLIISSLTTYWQLLFE